MNSPRPIFVALKNDISFRNGGVRQPSPEDSLPDEQHVPTSEEVQVPLEEIFQSVQFLMDDGQYEGALALLNMAERHREHHVGRYPLEALYLSQKGVCLALGKKRHQEGLQMCIEATGQTFVPPRCFLNLGQVYQAMGHRRGAYQAFRRGLALHPGHAELEKAARTLGERRRSSVASLPRTHFLNRALGILLAWVGVWGR